MEELKGLELIDEIVNDFVAEFDCDAEFGSEFLYWHDDATIQYSLIIGDKTDVIWTEYVKSTFDYSIDNIFVFSLLHEVGHHYTMDLFTNEELIAERRKIKRIEKRLNQSNSDLMDEGYYLLYFDLPMEKIATEWAVNYAKENQKALNEFWNKLQNALFNFYEMNLTE